MKSGMMSSGLAAYATTSNPTSRTYHGVDGCRSISATTATRRFARRIHRWTAFIGSCPGKHGNRLPGFDKPEHGALPGCDVDGAHANALAGRTDPVVHTGHLNVTRLEVVPVHRHAKVICSLLLTLAASAAFSQQADSDPRSFAEAVENEGGGRIGIAAVDIASGTRLEYRADERFPMCSTYKLLLAAQLLSRVDERIEDLDRDVPIAETDLVPYAPVVSEQLRAGHDSMTIRALCTAIMTSSDNSAANILLRETGGIEAFNRYVRSLGDGVTRLDNLEPLLSTDALRDERDSTTPSAFLDTVQRIVVGNALSAGSRALLLNWLEQSAVGLNRLRGGFDRSWRSGNKSGSGDNATTNDVAIVWPVTNGPAVIIAVYYSGSSRDPGARDRVLGRVGALILRHFGYR